jgi:hypothetical protein
MPLDFTYLFDSTVHLYRTQFCDELYRFTSKISSRPISKSEPRD